MVVVYDTQVGMTKRFATKLGYPIIHIDEYKGEPKEKDIFLVTRSTYFGQLTKNTQEFLLHFRDKVIGCAVNGNVNSDINCDIYLSQIERYYGVPVVKKFEGSGFLQDIEDVKNWISERKKRFT